MILQNIVFPSDEICEKGIYIRSSNVSSQRNGLYCIQQGEVISTDTYMNAFDVSAWKKYTNITELSLVWKLKGKGIIKVYWEKENGEAVCQTEIAVENHNNTFEEMRYQFQDFGQLDEGILYFRFYAETDSFIEAWFETEDCESKEIKISIVICTYKRKSQLEQLIKIIQSINGNSTSKPKSNTDWLRTIVIDNASELTEQYGEGITVYHNPNTGGSGGFSRGMKETVRNLDEFQATHVVLMDDDVSLQTESIYRLYALLTYVRPEYEQEVVAGRMFRLDKPHIQYTAVEIWNGGDIRHIGWNQDMTERQCLWNMNENTGGEYSGWWFACFPIEFVKGNEPLPFFLHCDDVEYGLRHGGTPIVLNGIQVWHETYEYRQSPVMAYYDCRNSLIVNSIYGGKKIVEDNIRQVLQTIKGVHLEQDYQREYYLLKACLDYLKREKWFINKDSGSLHDLRVKKNPNKFMNYAKLKWLEIHVNK